MNTDRIQSLRENYDKLNYGAYALADENDHVRLIYDILDLHFRISTSLDLSSLILITLEDCPLNITLDQVLDRLVLLAYDKSPEANFLLTLETLLLRTQNTSLGNYYLHYLEKYVFEYEYKPRQEYPPFYTTHYSNITHCAILNKFRSDLGDTKIFNHLLSIENKWEPWSLWEPVFGISRDHDMVLLTDFPMLLTLLCSCFFSKNHSGYFLGKLKAILTRSGEIDQKSLHGYIWMLIASRIAGAPTDYEHARIQINEYGGLPKLLIVKPYLLLAEEQILDKYKNNGEVEMVPEYNQWSSWLKPYLPETEPIFLLSIIECFLVIYNWDISPENFSIYCLKKSC